MTPPPSRDSIASAQSQASVFRLLTWKATIPIEIQLARESLPPGHSQESTVRHAVEGNQRSEDDDGDDEEDELPRYYVCPITHSPCKTYRSELTCISDASTTIHLPPAPPTRNRRNLHLQRHPVFLSLCLGGSRRIRIEYDERPNEPVRHEAETDEG
jgi:hypothetical protein